MASLCLEAAHQDIRFGTLSAFARWFGAKRKITGMRATREKEYTVLYYAVTFLLVAIVAAVFGFGGIASASAGIAQILFVIFLVLFLATLVMRIVRS